MRNKMVYIAGISLIVRNVDIIEAVEALALLISVKSCTHRCDISASYPVVFYKEQIALFIIFD